VASPARTGGVGVGRLGVGGLVARRDHQADLVYAGVEDLLDEDLQGLLLDAVAVHQARFFLDRELNSGSLVWEFIGARTSPQQGAQRPQ
jgi:hypothetical protein